jgi:hypothetical protein
MRNIGQVRVSDVNVKQGARDSDEWCAGAYAIRDTLGSDFHAAMVSVSSNVVIVEQGHGRWWAETPAEMADFIGAFDNAASEKECQALTDAASAGLLQWELTWHEGEPPESVRE